MCILLQIVLAASSQLLPQISILHEAKIKNYLLSVQKIILNEKIDEEDGLTITQKLAKEQEKVEKWMYLINEEITSFNTFQVTYMLLCLIMFLIFASSGLGIGVTITFTLFASFMVIYTCQVLYALAKPNIVWERQKILLLNNANVTLNLKFPESFKEWLEWHDINASKVFGTKVTFEKNETSSRIINIYFWHCCILIIKRGVERDCDLSNIIVKLKLGT